ncbi:uncharacterized protein LOC123867128 [Maniola jurtina]|uniref:uncharacterized protein LOC123867128 n=1 Tax=Maniola jurtina TaxID=191418 RepID=UPI001E686FF8|nr:uncharacterized protein LOC123867128 [Maniola jurtina]
MFKKFLTNLEDPKRPLLGPNYWILRKTGLILPVNLKWKKVRIVIHALGCLFVITQYMELFVIGWNLDPLLSNLKNSMLSIICTVKANTFIFWRANWKDLIEYVTEADKYERANKDKARNKILDSYTKYCRRVTYFYWVLVFMTFISVITTPLIKYLSSPSYRQAISNGTEKFPHIFSSWVPFDQYSFPGSWIQVSLQFSVSIYGSSIIAAYDSSVIVFMVFLGGKLELLRERCKQMFSGIASGVSDEDAAETIRELHSIHTLLMKYSKLLNSLLSPVMFLYVLMCTFMLCTTAFQLTTSTSTSQKLLMTQYLIFGVAQLFMFCWHSNDALEKNNQVAMGPYESKWWAASVSAKQRKNVMLLAGQLSLVHTADMDSQNSPERTVPIQYVRASRAFRQFKNPPQPHMCIQDTIKDTTEKLYINVLGWQKIANPKQYSDPIPLYGGMQVHQACGPNSNRPPLLVFAVMVNPDILKANGKNASNPTDREALVSLLCDFVEAMNPGLVLTRNPIILKDRDLAGELKDVWLAVQTKREREKGLNQDVMYKVYDIDGIGCEEGSEEDQTNSKNKQYDNTSPNRTQNCEKRKFPLKSSKQILKNAGQKSEFDSGMNNCQLNQNNSSRDNRCGNIDQDTTYCTPVYGQIVSTRENHNQINDIQQKFANNDNIKPSSSYGKDWQQGKTQNLEEFSNQNLSNKEEEYWRQNTNVKQNDSDVKKQKSKAKPVTNGKSQFDFFPVFDNKTAVTESPDIATGRLKEPDGSDEDNSKIILDPMQKLVLHSTDNKICDNNTSALSSYSS